MNSAFQRFCRLPSFERSMFVRAVLLLPVTVCALRLMRIKTLLRRIEARSGRHRVSLTVDQKELQWLAQTAQRMLMAASRYGVVRGNCLSRSIVLYHLLRQEGVPVALRIGVSKEGKRFAAHAWVELDGLGLNDLDGLREKFVPFEGKTGADWIRER